jgi:hypothetical protein
VQLAVFHFLQIKTDQLAKDDANDAFDFLRRPEQRVENIFAVDKFLVRSGSTSRFYAMFTYINKIYSFTDSGVNYFFRVYDFFFFYLLRNQKTLQFCYQAINKLRGLFFDRAYHPIIILSAVVSRIFFHEFSRAFSD